MTLRRIHQNVHIIKQQSNKIPNITLITPTKDDYDEQQPPHPKTAFRSPPWKNQKIRINIPNIAYSTKAAQHLKANTARQGFRTHQIKQQRINYSSINSRHRLEAPSSDNTPRKNHENLFVPEPTKTNQKSKINYKPSRIKNQQKQTRQTFSLKQNKNIKSFNKIGNSSKVPRIEDDESISSINLISLKTPEQVSKLRRYEKQQKKRESLLSNRLKFITVDNQRENKKLEMVKRKVEKIVSIRSQFLKQKETINQVPINQFKRKLSNYLQEMNYKHHTIHLIKEHQQQRKLSVSRFSKAKSLQASILRNEEKLIEKQIQSFKQTELHKNKEAVRHIQQILEKSRSRVSSVKQNKINSIRSIENKALVKNYINFQRRQKINKQLYQALERQIQSINQKKLKSAAELKQYEDFLGLRVKKQFKQPNQSFDYKVKVLSLSPTLKGEKIDNRPDGAFSSTNINSTSKSFYLTNL